jgi:alpha-beta hydrolase superfamily lysophospholipase
MKTDTFSFKTDDGTKISAFRWLPDNKDSIKGIVQISHGMAEHAGRYKDIARVLTQAGYAVYANDHRGHGKTAGNLDDVGYLAPKNGWDMVVDDMYKLNTIIRKENPGLPVYLLGSSMGSLLSRSYIMRYGDKLAGAILIGTNGDPGALKYIGLLISKLEMKMKGKKARSPLLNKLSFGNYNKAFAPNRTGFDWISKDTSNVDAYVDDPYCGFVCTSGFFYDLVTGVDHISKLENVKKTPKELPILFLSGEDDPVGNMTKGVIEVYDLFKKAGIKDVSYKFYTGVRHEILNDFSKEEVFRNIIEWLDDHLKEG